MQRNEKFLELMRVLTTFEPRVMEEEASLRIRTIGFPQYSQTAKGGKYKMECLQRESSLTRLANEVRLSLSVEEVPRVVTELEFFRQKLRHDMALAHEITKTASLWETDFWSEIYLYFQHYEIRPTWQMDSLKERAYVSGWHELAKAMNMSLHVAEWLLVEIGRYFPQISTEKQPSPATEVNENILTPPERKSRPATVNNDERRSDLVKNLAQLGFQVVSSRESKPDKASCPRFLKLWRHSKKPR